MAVVALSSLMGTIKLEFLHPNHRVSLLDDDDDKAVKSLLQKLSYMEAILKKEYSKDYGGAPTRDLQIKIRDFALKAEDDIEKTITLLLLLLLLPKEGEGGEHQQKEKELQLLQLHQTLQQVAKDADELLNNIIDNQSEDEDEDEDEVEVEAAAASQFEEDIVMVGRERGFNTIRRYLLGKDYAYPERIVLSISGPPGIGKTTLCKKLYTDKAVVSHFDIQAWVTIPPRYNGNVQQVLCHLLQSMRPTPLNEEEIDDIMLQGSTVSQLKDQLYKHLQYKRYFIVLDDVPNTLLWEDIHQCFPGDSYGSNILITTLFRDVADYICEAWYVTILPYLSDIDSCNLFSHRFSLKQYMTPKFAKIAKHLVDECGGLPRSIVTVADRLSKCNCTLKEWKKIEKELLSLGILHRNAQHSNKLTDIYNRLPQHLKVCFLYFAVFPKHSQIHVKTLIKLWIAEGFVKPRRCLPLEDIGNMYLWDLRIRGLITIVRERFGEPETCGIHIDLHSFCVREAQKEGLLCAVTTQQCIGWSSGILTNSCRWLSLRSHSLDYHVLFSSNIPRSIFSFQRDFEMFVTFKHLRSLNLSESQILKGVSLPLRNLVCLRYLSVPQWFENLDDVISTNSNLQTLIVSGGIDKSRLGAPALLHLPSKIWELQHLRHLELGDMYVVDPPNMVNENLQTLICALRIHFRKKEVYYYYKRPSIRKMEVVYKDVLVSGCGGGRCCRNPIIILENFEDLLSPEILTVMVPVGSITLLERVGFPANLKKLRLSGTNFPVKVLMVIGKLPMLKVLKLENAFYGRVWEVVDEGGFCELEELEVEARSLERWVGNSSHFPKLKHLFLKRCHSLEEIPPDFAKLSTFWLSIKLERCHPSVVTSAMWIQKQRRGYIYTEVIVDGKDRMHFENWRDR